jgi:hypothetical protein
MGSYVVVLRARASAIFYPGDSFSMNYALHEGGSFSLTFRTTYEGGFEVPVPKNFCVEARGPAKDLHQAAELFGEAGFLHFSISLRSIRCVTEGEWCLV